MLCEKNKEVWYIYFLKNIELFPLPVRFSLQIFTLLFPGEVKANFIDDRVVAI